MKPIGDYRKCHRDWLAISGFVVAFLTLIATLIGVFMQLRDINTGIRSQNIQLADENAQLEGQKAQLKQQADLGSAQYVLAMSNDLDSAKYARIITAIEGQGHTYSPLTAGLGITDAQLEDYMSEFDTIGDLYRDNIITFQMAYDEFSYDTEKAYCNNDVQADIKRDRASDIATGTDMFWSGFQDMATAFLNRDGYTCTSTILDNQ